MTKPPRNYSLLLGFATIVYLILMGIYARGEDAKPQLKVWAQPTIALASIRGAEVMVKVEITGKLTEDFYCPEVSWLWPDETVSVEESDCVVWEDAYLDGAKPQVRWERGAVFPEGEWPVTVELRKGGQEGKRRSGKLVAKQVAVVRVVG